MIDEKVMQVDMVLTNKVTPQQMYIINEGLKQTSDNATTEIFLTKFKESYIVILLGIFLGNFGADRFYIKDNNIGVTKLIVGIVILIAAMVSGVFTVLGFGPGAILFLVIYGISIIYSILCIIDIFQCFKKAKENNFKAVMKIIQKYKLTNEEMSNKKTTNNVFAEFGELIVDEKGKNNVKDIFNDF